MAASLSRSDRSFGFRNAAKEALARIHGLLGQPLQGRLRRQCPPARHLPFHVIGPDGQPGIATGGAGWHGSTVPAASRSASQAATAAASRASA